MRSVEQLPPTLFTRLERQPNALINTSGGYLYPEGVSVNCTLVHDGDPSPDFVDKHRSSDLLTVHRKACPFEAFVRKVDLNQYSRGGARATDRFIAGCSSYDEYFFPVDDGGRLYIFVRSTPWVAPAKSMRHFSFEEITEEADCLRPGEMPADVYFDRIAPRLKHPLIDPDFVARIQAPRYEFRTGSYESFLATLSELAGWALARQGFPRFQGNYSVVLTLEGLFVVKLSRVTPHPRGDDWQRYDALQEAVTKRGLTALKVEFERAANHLFQERVCALAHGLVRLAQGNPIYRRNWVDAWSD